MCIVSVPHDLFSQDVIWCEWLHIVVFVCLKMMSSIARSFLSRPNSNASPAAGASNAARGRSRVEGALIGKDKV